MKNRIFRTLALGIGLTAIFATSGLNATIFYSGRVNIPFEFRAGKQIFAAGEYRVEQDYGHDIAYVVNIRTGQRIQMLRPLNGRQPMKMTINFENIGGVRVLKGLS